MDALITDPLSLVARWAGVDIIGDVHGYADKIERLLASMGYCEIEGVWAHPSRGAISEWFMPVGIARQWSTS